MRTELIVDGNAVYEIDLDCMQERVRRYVEQFHPQAENGSLRQSGTLVGQEEHRDGGGRT